MTVSAARYSTPLVIPQNSSVPDTQVADELTRIYFALRALALNIDVATGLLSSPKSEWTAPYDKSIVGGNGYKFRCRCLSNISYGAFVDISLSGGEAKATPAQANAATNVASGFCNFPVGFTTGEIGEFIVGPGVNSGISGLVIGSWYWLSPTSALGQVQNTRPVTSGQVDQMCGIALAADKLLVGSLNNWRVV